MVKINYQTFGSKGFQLRLRFYKDGETKFINVTKLLKGNIQAKHWNQKRQHFIPSCPYADENNEILVLFRQRYDRLALNWSGTVAGFLLAMENAPKEADQGITLSAYLGQIISELRKRRHPDGSQKGTYEDYEKVHRRLADFCKYKKTDYDRLLLADLTPQLVSQIFEWVRKERGGHGMTYISKVIRAVAKRAANEGLIDFSGFDSFKWHKAPTGSSARQHTLTQKQIDTFIGLPLDQLPPTRYAELFRDVCVFMLHTGQSICDLLSLTSENIQDIGGVPHLVFKRRKIAHKQNIPCAVPMGKDVRRIIDRWKMESFDNFFFPVRTKEKMVKEGAASNGDIKYFTRLLNVWLKEVGKILGCKFPLHTYAFRHTAITRYIGKGVPTLYVASMMGTSVKNCEKIYYDNSNDKDSRNKIMDLMD